MSSSNPYLGVAHYSLMNALELFKTEDERHLLGTIVLVDLSVESALKAELSELKPAKFIGFQQEKYRFPDLVTQLKENHVLISPDEELRLFKIHDVRNSAQHEGSIPDSLRTRQYLKWAISFVKRFSIDNFGVNIDLKIPPELKGVFTELTQQEERKSAANADELKEPLEENYETIRKWFRHLETHRVGVPLPKDRKKKYLSSVKKYCLSQFVGMNPDRVIEDALSDSHSTGISKVHSQKLKNFLDNLEKGSKTNYYTDIKSFYKHNGINLQTQRPYYQPRYSVSELNNNEIQKILEKASIEHKSWILANSYMGLDVGSLRFLTVADFHISNWVNEEKLYPIRIRKEVNKNKFAYTTYIGPDAKKLLENYFKGTNLTLPSQKPWGMFHSHTIFSNAFKDLVGKAGLIPELKEKTKTGLPRGPSPLPAKTLKKRLERILRKYAASQSVLDHIMGYKPDKSQESGAITDYEVKEVYLKALEELQIYKT